jgi:hypothetical protein
MGVFIMYMSEFKNIPISLLVITVFNLILLGSYTGSKEGVADSERINSSDLLKFWSEFMQ